MELWERLEKEVVMIVDGKLTNGSGRFSTKGDVRTENLYVECKHRTKRGKGKSSLALSWFRTAEYHVRGTLMVPLIAYQEDREGSPSPIQFFCRKDDSELFETMDCPEYGYPSDWVPVTRESVREYARS